MPFLFSFLNYEFSIPQCFQFSPQDGSSLLNASRSIHSSIHQLRASLTHSTNLLRSNQQIMSLSLLNNTQSTAQSISEKLIQLAPLLSSTSFSQAPFNPTKLLFTVKSNALTISNPTVPILLAFTLSIILAILSLLDFIGGTIGFLQHFNLAQDQYSFLKKAIGWRYIQGWRPTYSFLLLLFSSIQASHLLILLNFQTGESSRQEIKLLGISSFLISIVACFYLCGISTIKSKASLATLEEDTLEERRGERSNQSSFLKTWTVPFLSLLGATTATIGCSFGLKYYLSSSKDTDSSIEALASSSNWTCTRANRALCSEDVLSQKLTTEATSGLFLTLLQIGTLSFLLALAIYVSIQSYRSTQLLATK